MTKTHWGAYPDEWELFSKTLGLTKALLPIVSNPHATISPKSTVDSLGKLPSKYVGGEVMGIGAWVDFRATDAAITKWANVTDYGFGINCGLVRAADFDLKNKSVISVIKQVFLDVCGFDFPVRSRDDSTHILIPYFLEGEYTKRVLGFPDTKKDGMIEFLANGQQFVACGTHPSEARYKWTWPDENNKFIPTITPEQFEEIYETIKLSYPTLKSSIDKEHKKEKLKRVEADDDILRQLKLKGVVTGENRNGKIPILCPFAQNHGSEKSAATSTVYLLPNTGGYTEGRIDCRHATCKKAGYHTGDFLAEIGIETQKSKSVNEFADLDEAECTAENLKPNGYGYRNFHEVAKNAKPVSWLIYKAIDANAEVGMIWGPPGSGKSFMVLDMAYAVARGVPWRGFDTKQGPVVYVAAEGAGGLPKRIKAYEKAYNIAGDDVPLYLLDGVPNLAKEKDIERLIVTVKEIGGVKMVIIDTVSSSAAGSNENDAKDMSIILQLCRRIQRETGAVVFLVHHSGKDVDKGPRGSSAMNAAVDFNMSTTKNEKKQHTLKFNKQRDAEDNQEYGFELDVVTLDEKDEEGNVVDSCVIKPLANVPQKLTGRPQAKGARQKAVRLAIKKFKRENNGEWPDRNAVHENTRGDYRNSAKDESLDAMVAKGAVEKLNGTFNYIGDDDDDE